MRMMLYADLFLNLQECFYYYYFHRRVTEQTMTLFPPTENKMSGEFLSFSYINTFRTIIIILFPTADGDSYWLD